MSKSSPARETDGGAALWKALLAYEIGPSDAALSFAQRLARENGWSFAFADRVILEYKRFCFLAVTAGREVTPSDQVDQAWHLHLTYSRDYWQRFCPQVLGRDLHHGPTAGGAAESARYFEQYAQTLRAYEAAFLVSPPADIWPDARQRFLQDPRARRVHPRDGVVVPHRFLKIFIGFCSILALFAFALLWRS